MMREKAIIFNKKLRELVHFERLGFQDYENDDFFHTWKLKRENNSKTDVINYGFSKDKWEDDMFLLPIRLFIVFQQINKILIRIDKSNLYNFFLLEPTIIQFPKYNLEKDKYNYQQRDLLFVKNRVVNEQVLEKALIIFKEQLDTTVLPFFDKIQTLQDVNDEILEKVDWMEWSNYISGQATFKALIIMKLCDSEKKYQEFSQFYKERISNAIQEGKTEYQDLYNTLVELLNYLDKGKYLEVI
jgi:hypothetical protein